MLYAGLSLFRWRDNVRSSASLGLGGVVLVMASIAAGLGCSALIGITFNASTTQIVPFLALGLGLDSMFLMVNSYSDIAASEISQEVRKLTNLIENGQ